MKPASFVLLCSLVLTLPPARAQLNENCTVAILNRTAQVKTNGSWRIDNIPANFGQVRARATCVQNGQTLSGQSNLFTIAANQVTGFDADIVLGPVTPIPTALTLSANPVTLTQPGQLAPVTVTGTYSNAPSANLTNAGSGTQYRTSNPALATISANGVVTALKSGTVLVQATNEGTQGLLQLSIALSRDSDGDGILDDIELANGLDPNNPADALDDPDHDGLTNREELLRGTDIHNPDTDGDGLKDGDEVNVYHTNPLLQDSDGDGVPDNIEIATGSDPNDASSRNLAAALSGIRVAPPAFVINVNSVQGTGSQQLTVTGDFKVGGTIDLTPRARGTNYGSDNLAVCNFGAQDGLIFGSADGSCKITITNSGFTATATGTVLNFSPLPLSFVSIPGFANNVDVSGDFAYVAAGSTGLQVVNVSNRNTPLIVGSYNTTGNANDVKVVGNLAYIADGSSGLQIVNVATPTAPVLVGSFDTPGDASDVVVTQNKAFIADGTGGLRIIDVTIPAAPSQIGSLSLPGTAKGVDVDLARGIAVVAAGLNGLHIVNIANLAAPALITTVAGGDVRDVLLNGNFAYLADYSRSFTAVDLSVPANPILKPSADVSLGGLLMDVAMAGRFAAGADVAFVNGVPILDVTAPGEPVPRSILDFRAFRDDNGTGLAMDGSYVYLTAQRGLGTDNGVTEDTRLYIGQYLSRQDTFGVAPQVSLLSPAQNGTAIQGTTLSMVVSATDDVAVTSVSFLVNGQVAFTATRAPYEFTYLIPTNVTSLTLAARATDFGGNVGTSATRTITVIADPKTTVTGRVLDTAAQPVGSALTRVLTAFAFTATDGSFSIANVPTIRGDVQAIATKTVSGVPYRGVSASVPPVSGGVTDVGTVTVRPGAKVAIYVMDAPMGPGGVTASGFTPDVQAKLQSTGQFTQVDVLVGPLAQVKPAFSSYDAILVYPESATSDFMMSNLGNAVADYVDAGGGLVVATFAFASGNGVGILGRIKAGNYLPFTTSQQSSSPVNQTLLKVLSGHPLLAGVSSFNGGTSSFHNNPIALTAGATLVANWSDGQPLIGFKGRVVGLNFFPPSQAVRADFWLTSTDGALILANALSFAAGRL